MPTETNEVETTIVYQPEVAQQVLAAIEEVEPVTEEPEFISNEDYRELLALAINDAEVWVSQAESLINKIDNGEKIKGTKLNGAVRNGRLEILRSSLTDVKTAKVSG
jgi:hypothetical protein